MRYEFLILLRSKVVIFALIALAFLTGLSLINGLNHIAQLKQMITNAQQTQVQHHANIIIQNTHAHDVGDAAYYTFYIVNKTPEAWSFISLGNLNANPKLQRIRMLGLQSQLYDSDPQNPEYAVAGNFDYAFMIVFLLPLICIALAHNMRPTEHIEHRIGLIESLHYSLKLFWIKRFFARLILLLMAVLTPLLVVVYLNHLPFVEFSIVAAMVGAYALFWLLLSGLIGFTHIGKHAASSAMIALTFWLCMTLVLPTLAKIIIDEKHPVIDGAEIALAHRKKVNDAWDIPKDATFELFFNAYPEWKNTAPVLTRFHWKLYYAFHHVADLHVQTLVNQREISLQKRDEATKKLGFFLPAVGMQYWFDSLSKNDLKSLIEYRKQVTQFHTKLRQYFYPFLFNEIPFTEKDFKAIPAFKHA